VWEEEEEEWEEEEEEKDFCRNYEHRLQNPVLCCSSHGCRMRYKLRSPTWEHLNEEADSGILHVALGCDNGVMIIYDDGDFSHTGVGIPKSLMKRLSGLQKHVGVNFVALSQSDPDCYFISFTNGQCCWNRGSCDEEFDDLVYKRDTEFVVFGAIGSYYIKFCDGSSQWRLSDRHSAKIKVQAVQVLSLGPKDEMFTRYLGGSYAWIDTPSDTVSCFKKLLSKSCDVHQVILASEDSWVMRFRPEI
jgi:hypothetical protein